MIRTFINRLFAWTVFTCWWMLVAALAGVGFSFFIGILISLMMWEWVLVEFVVEAAGAAARMFAALVLIFVSIGTFNMIGTIGSDLDKVYDDIVGGIRGLFKK